MPNNPEIRSIKVAGGKLYLLNKPGTMWNLWDVSTNKLTQAMLSCQNGVISETGFPVVQKKLSQEEQVAKEEADIAKKCSTGEFPAIYAVCQPKEKRLQYLKDQFAQAKKPMSGTVVNSFGPGFENSELAFSNWKYVSSGPVIVTCDELVTKYGFTHLGSTGNWATDSNRVFYDLDGKLVGSGGAMITINQYVNKLTGQAMTEPDVMFAAIGNCHHANAGTSVLPTFEVSRTFSDVNGVPSQVLSYTTKDVKKLAYSCVNTSNPSKQLSGDSDVTPQWLPLPSFNSTTAISALSADWGGYNDCVWTITGKDGTVITKKESFDVVK